MAYANAKHMSTARKASLFRNGRSQAVRIPKEFEMPGTEVVIEKDGDVVLLRPLKPVGNLAEWIATLEPLDIEWPEIEDYPPEPVDLGFDESDGDNPGTGPR